MSDIRGMGKMSEMGDMSDMGKACVTTLRAVTLDVTDLDVSRRFYSDVWGLQAVPADDGVCRLRARGAKHHVLTLRQAPQPGLAAIEFNVRDAAALERLFIRSQHSDWRPLGDIAAFAPSAGGGVGFELVGPEGLQVKLLAESADHDDTYGDHSMPLALTHVVLNSADVSEQMRFFTDLLGFQLSDSTSRMEFIRCGEDHHSVAIAYGDNLSLNHIAFDMHDIDSLMYGSGRVVGKGHALEWGVGRHGPGNNVFAYFLDPDGLAVEYTTDMLKVDDATWTVTSAEEWARFPMRPCRWGMAPKPSAPLTDAMAGRRPQTHGGATI